MEYTLTRLLKSGDRVVGAMGYRRNDGRFVVIKAGATILASGGWGRMYRYTSNSWEGTGDGAAMAYEAGADLLDMEFVQFHPTGMIWPPGRARHPRHRGGARRGRPALQQRAPALHARVRPGEEGAELARRGGPLHLQGGQGRPRLAARRRLPRHHPPRRRLHQARSCRRCTSSSTRWPPSTSPRRRWRWGRPSTTPWAACASTPRPRRPPCPGCTRPVRWPAACTAPTGSAATRSATSSSSAGVPASPPPSSREQPARRGPSTSARWRQEQDLLYDPLDSRHGWTDRENPYHLHEELQAAMQDDAGIGRSAEFAAARARRHPGAARADRADARGRPPRPQPGLAHLPRRHLHAHRQRGDRAQRHASRGEPRIAVALRLPRAGGRAGQGELRGTPRRRRDDASRRCRCGRCPRTW